MDIPFPRWHSAIYERRSRRRFDSKPVESNPLSYLYALCAAFRPFTTVRAVLVTEAADKVFKGIVGAYGKIKGAPAFIAFVGNMDSPHVQEEIGYMGEGIILETTALGLGSCWIGGFFKPEVAAALTGTKENERVLCVTPIGYVRKRQSFEERIMSVFGLHNRRKPLSRLTSGLEEKEWPEWISSVLEAARLAPSAVNRQPWRFHIEPNSITVSVDGGSRDSSVSKRLDCGIAMLHIEVAALNYGIQGRWEFLDAPQVARFNIA